MRNNWNWEWIVDFISWLGAVIVGASAKLAYEGMNKPLKKSYIIGTFVMAIFAGFVIDGMAASYGIDKMRGVVTSVGALTCDAVVKHLLATNWRDIFKNKQ